MRKGYYTALFLFSLSTSWLACKRQKINEQESEPPTETVTKKQLIPIKFVSDKLSLTFEYQAGTTLMTKISHSDNSHTLISYQPKYYRVEQVKNNTVYHYADFILTDGKATKVHTFDSFGRVDIPTGHYTLGYNLKGELAEIVDYNVSNELILKKEISYDAAGNIVELKVADKQNKTTLFEYKSDNKNGIFKNVNHARLLFLEIADDFLCPDVNNWLSSKNALIPQQDIKFSYLYNADDYPTQMIMEGPQGKQTFTITYAEVSN